MADAIKGNKALMDLLSRLAADINAAGRDGGEEKKPQLSAREEILRQKFRTLFGARFEGKTFDTYRAELKEQKLCLETCRKYSSSLEKFYRAGEGILFAGNAGTGKTHLSYAIGKEILRRGYSLEVRKFHEIIRETRSSDEPEGSREEEVIEKYTSCDFLILEELGVPWGNERGMVLLYDIVDGRYKRGLPTLFTSNLRAGELSDFLDSDGKNRIWDRIREVSTILNFSWSSYRNGPAI